MSPEPGRGGVGRGGAGRGGQGERGGPLKGTVTPTALEWPGPWYLLGLRRVCSALSSSFTIIILWNFWMLFGLWDYYYLQIIGLLPGSQGAFTRVPLLALESLTRPTG